MSFDKLMSEARANIEAQEKGQELELAFPSGKASGCFLTVHGPDTAAFREAGRRTRELREKEKRGLIEQDPEQAAKDDAHFLSWLVSGWRQAPPKDAKPDEVVPKAPSFSRESVEQLLNAHPVYRMQMWELLNDRSGFTPA